MATLIKFLGLLFLILILGLVWPGAGGILWDFCAVAGLWIAAKSL